MKDTNDILVQQTKNIQATRQIRFKNFEEIRELESSVKTYIFETIEVEKVGLEVKMKKTSEFDMPEEFKKALEDDANLKKAIQSLTPGRQRGYLLYFSNAQQSKIRTARMEKCTGQILNGKGLND
ncbi:YdeI/OmpD-associated family protein [Gillisia sp. Hel_I_86]|uniref:YdeI/OmpD-associated family protein n=1 Tax=Gillisia sp. Hel_I_86 TaxID=1249981 RepID=UPI0028F74088|nr:YdeI/OmpD-associated family protein [Gillisia sp. Hel_I_86]